MRSRFFLVFFVFFAAPFWFTELQLKQFARHKCYDKTLWIYTSPFFLFVQYQTQGTLVGLLHLEKPLLFGIVPESQYQPIPRRVQSLLGVAAVYTEEVCMCWTPSLNPQDSFLHAQFNSYSFLYAKLSQQLLGIGGLEKNPSLKKGYFFKKFQNILRCAQTSQK